MTLATCSEWSRAQGLDPGGTAGNYRGFLLVEHPLPWPGDASDVAELAEVSRLASKAGLRLQLLAAELVAPGDGRPEDGDAASPRNARRVVCYRQTREGWAGEVERSEVLVDASSVGDAVEELVSGRARPGSRDGLVADVLVCTHGRRDRCCGSRGTELFANLVAQPLDASAGAGEGGAGESGAGESGAVRLWRTSHTGGHRFSPTAVVFPSATLWGYVDRPLLQSVLASVEPVSDWLARYRGCATLGTPAQQAVERAVLAEVGWKLLSTPRRAVDAGPGTVSLETEGLGTWEGDVREGRRVPQPECGGDPATASKYGVEWVVEGLRRTG